MFPHFPQTQASLLERVLQLQYLNLLLHLLNFEFMASKTTKVFHLVTILLLDNILDLSYKGPTSACDGFRGTLQPVLGLGHHVCFDSGSSN
jgi:hypothetical protein